MAEGGSITEGVILEEQLAQLQEQGAIDENTIVIMQQDGEDVPGHLSMEQNITLEGGDQPMQLSAAQLGEAGYTITTTENGETYISSPDGQLLTQVSTTDEQQLVYSTDGEQLVLQDTASMVTESTSDDQMVITSSEQEAGGSQTEYQNLIVQNMDISEPLTTLRRLLEAKLHCSLQNHVFYLQNAVELDIDQNLTTQCAQGKGIVQINVEVLSSPGLGCKPRLNIVDILKPAEDVVEELVQEQATTHQPTSKAQKSKPKVVIPLSEENDNVTRWIVDQNFRREQERLKIPQDPSLWNEAHVNHWIKWAINEFKLEHVQPEAFANITGKDLFEMRHDEFSRLVVNDRGDSFWTHLELLRKCNFVAVVQQPTPHAITTITVSSSDPLAQNTTQTQHRMARQPGTKNRSIFLGSDRISPGNRTGNNGQIQLWQFLLELLTDKECKDIIHWVGDEGEFKLANQESVAQLWGTRKNKSTMNYEKLSRALRYYYDGDMIAKVHGKRFVYKFVCDLRMLLGYSAGELSRLVNECSVRQMSHLRDTINTPQPSLSTQIAAARRTSGSTGGHVIIPHKSRQIRQAVASIQLPTGE